MTDEESYEIRLTNKALVFYFMAGATGLILSFLAGVMVGRGVDAPGGEVQAARPGTSEERVVTEETPRPATATEDLTYAQKLEGDKADEGLEKPRTSGRPAASPPAAASAASPAARPPASGAPVTAAKAPPATLPPVSAATPKPVAARPTPSARPSAAPPSGGAFSIQVAALKDKASAEAIVGRLKGRGFAAYVISPSAADGLYTVRVGSFPARVDAERVQARLRDEKFQPFIVRN